MKYTGIVLRTAPLVVLGVSAALVQTQWLRVVFVGVLTISASVEAIAADRLRRVGGLYVSNLETSTRVVEQATETLEATERYAVGIAQVAADAVVTFRQQDPDLADMVDAKITAAFQTWREETE